MSEYNKRWWRAARLSQAREAVEEGSVSYAEILEDINKGKYAITPDDESRR